MDLPFAAADTGTGYMDVEPETLDNEDEDDGF
jgi:hypothetical protein